MAIISEPHQKHEGEGNELSITLAFRRTSLPRNRGAPGGSVHEKVKAVYIYDCCAPTSATLDEYEQMMNGVFWEARGRWPKTITGYFIAWSLECTCRITNVRGSLLGGTHILFGVGV